VSLSGAAGGRDGRPRSAGSGSRMPTRWPKTPTRWPKTPTRTATGNCLWHERVGYGTVARVGCAGQAAFDGGSKSGVRRLAPGTGIVFW